MYFFQSMWRRCAYRRGNVVQVFRATSLCHYNNARRFTASAVSIRKKPHVHNSLTRSLQVLQPVDNQSRKDLTWYACGPTVYDVSHLGHARTYVCFDIVRRILSDLCDIPVHQVMNITDIDDKILNRARESNVSVESLTRKYEAQFKQDMEWLNVTPPREYVRVSEKIPQIISYIETLVTAGFAYESDGDIYFDIAAFSEAGFEYGKLASVYTAEQALLDGATVAAPSEEVADEKTRSHAVKKHQSDFALWKRTLDPSVDLCWQSPWSAGRPGWHVECSAISQEAFGSRLDVHSGGVDLCFPHHTNEIAQCEAYNQSPDKTWCDVFLHTGHVHIAGRKMSKSLKNFISIRHFLRHGADCFTLVDETHDKSEELIWDSHTRLHAEQFRLFCLAHHYDSTVEFSADSLQRAAVILHRYQSILETVSYFEREVPDLANEADEDGTALEACLASTRGTVDMALLNNFDTPGVSSALHHLISDTNKYISSRYSGANIKLLTDIKAYLVEVWDLLGLEFHKWTDSKEETDVLESFIAFRSQIRDDALKILRAKKDHSDDTLTTAKHMLKLCDQLRDDVVEHGIELKDVPNGKTTWRRIS